MPKKFLYFSYGSNLLSKRIHINNPSAVREGIGKLLNYRLDFNKYSNWWNGSIATIVPDKNHYVWGALWEINIEHLSFLDKQEGVPIVYFRFEVDIELPNGKRKLCYTYQLVDNPAEYCELSELPKNRQPSYAYLNTIITGAKESELPHDYINLLSTIHHNGYDGKVF